MASTHHTDFSLSIRIRTEGQATTWVRNQIGIRSRSNVDGYRIKFESALSV
jgi:hypothetical protein